MLYPSYCVKNLGACLEMEKLPRQAANEALNLYFTIFKENSKKSREMFFSQALIQFLWRRYITKSPEVLLEYLRIVKNERKTGK
jgi:hypothetical protein